MFTESEKSKSAAAEIATLAMFIISLVFAYGLTQARNRIHLTDAIPLAESGLAVSLPNGQAWLGMENWQSDAGANAFILQAKVAISKRPEVLAQWQYSLGQSDLTAVEHLNRQIDAAAVNTEQQGVVTQAGLSFAWAQIQTSETSADAVLAVATLPANRTLELRIEAIAQPKLAMQLFDVLISSVNYEPMQNYQQSLSFIQRFREAGLYASLISELGPNLERTYLAEITQANDQQQYAGFSYFSHAFSSAAGESGQLTGQGLFSLVTGRGYSEHHQFTIQNSLKSYTWRSKQQISSGRATAMVNLELEDGSDLTVTRLQGPMRSADNERRYDLPQTSLPEVFIDTAAHFMLSQPFDSVDLQIVTAGGVIAPANMRKIPAGDLPATNNSDIVFGIAVNFTHGHSAPQKLYYNIDKKLVSQESVQGIIWRPIRREKLLDAIPADQADAIRRISKPATRI